MKKLYSTHYISGTHWDREWYRPFQEFRWLLVKLVDALLDLMESNPDFRYFQLDGQTCVLADYVELRPENRDRLQRLMQAGRILVGPWFTMPDLFCPGDEALIRNLLLGRRISREWGVEPMPVGFICDMFGHPSQIPQIFAGFDIHDVVLGRGTNEHTNPTYFYWDSPSRTRAFVFKLPDAGGYGAFAAPRTVLEKPTSLLAGMEELLAELETAGDDEPKRIAVREKWFRLELAKYVDHEISRVNGTTLCLMDSMDHILPATDVARYLRLIREACPSVSPRHSTLPLFFVEARQTARCVPVKRGELREPSKNRCGYLWLIPNCVSARMRLKQANDACQNLLEKWVEPLLAIHALDTTATDASLLTTCLRTAWQHVLTNHAHDSICGCSIDQVHRDMMYRFDQARIMGDQLRSQAIGALTSGCADLATTKDEFTLTLVNPLPHPRHEVVVFDVDLPTDYPAEFAEGFSGQRIKAFLLENAAGRPVPYQRLGVVPVTNERSRHAQFCFMSDGEFSRYTVAAHVVMPALGFASLRVKPAPTPVRPRGTLRTGPTAAENQHLAIAIESNGTLTITDKATRQTYTNLLTFEDRSEVGDGWFHAHSVNDEQYLSTACPAQISVVQDGPEIVTFRATVTMRVPARYEPKAERPSDRKADLVISSCISLRRGARVVDVETTVENTAEDHRLKVLFPTDVIANTYLAHHPYDFVERPIALDPQTTSWQEMEQAEKPFLGLQAVGGGRRGLAFISGGGLHEGGVVDDARRTLQVTLLRAFRKTVSTGGERDGLEPGRLVYRYALLPFAGRLPRAQALVELTKLQAGIFARQTGKRPSGFPPLTGKESATQGFMQLLNSHLVVAAIKPPETGPGLILRLWNPTGRTQREKIVFRHRIAAVRMLQLNEDPAANASRTPWSGSGVTVQASAHQIVTLRVEFQPTQDNRRPRQMRSTKI
ncbi:MAG: Mannosylglycerate hydrolase [Verrucomicrobiae bacterium]|nr:Mannosylglycerate hydrolase [Verrucomicrobiae bacterium]